MSITRTVQIISDVHTEFGVSTEKFASLLKQADITVLAGDIVNRASSLAPFLRECKRFSNSIVFVCGNHEYYKGSKDEEYERVCKEEGVTFLQRNRVLVNGLWFCGATLWTDVADEAKRLMNDPFTAAKVREMHEGDKQWLKETVKEGDIVATHHLPTFQLIHPKYQTSTLNSAFASDLEDVIKETKPRMWICGHTHTPFDIEVENTRIIVNPVGYPKENAKFEFKIVTISNE